MDSQLCQHFLIITEKRENTTGHLATTELAKRSKAEKTKAERKKGNRHAGKFGVMTLKTGAPCSAE